MTMLDQIDITEFLEGPEILCHNIFRIAQMPVDATERELKRRLKALEMAQKMDMSPQSGLLPIFPLETENMEAFKKALLRNQDPLHRLINELFWFWPENFGDSASDEGLALLKADQIEAAIGHWKKGELETENHISTHNLALLYQFLALQIDKIVVENKTPLEKQTKDAKTAMKYWQESFSRWQLLSRLDGFRYFLKMRIRDYNDPRLPEDATEWVQEQIPSIVLSINMHLILNAVDAGMVEHVAQQWNTINNSKFDEKQINGVIKIFTRSHRNRIKHFCQAAKEAAKQDPVYAKKPTRLLAEQVGPVLEQLIQIYPKGDKSVSFLSDNVAMTIVECTDIYDGKTQDWQTSKGLLKLARSFAVGKVAKDKVKKDIEQIDELIEEGNDWCLPGYFELPEACVTLLDEARELKNDNRHKKAIKLLAGAYTGKIPLPEHDDLRRYVSHCLAYIFKVISVETFNSAFTERDQKVKKLLSNYINYSDNSSFTSYSVSCTNCNGSIDGDYVTRIIEERKYPFCLGCDSSLENKWDDILNSFKPVIIENIQNSLDLLNLAVELDSSFKPAIKNLKVITEEAQDEGVISSEILDLKISWDLLVIDDFIPFLKSEKSIQNTVETKQVWRQFIAGINSVNVASRNKIIFTILSTCATDELKVLYLLMSLNEQGGMIQEEFLNTLNDSQLQARDQLVFFKHLVRHQEDDVRYNALNWIDTNLENQDEKIKFFITSLGYPSSQAAEFAKDRLTGMKEQALGRLLEACLSNDIVQLKKIHSLLSQSATPEFSNSTYTPSPTTLIRICLTVKDKRAVTLARSFLEIVYENWSAGKEARACIPWLKHATQKAPLENSETAEDLLTSIQQRSSRVKFLTWFKREAKIPVLAHKYWWDKRDFSEMIPKGERKQTQSIRNKEKKKGIEPCSKCDHPLFKYDDYFDEYICRKCGWISKYKLKN